jgi:hypothetical protein
MQTQFSETDKRFYEYCCKDSAVTYEINSYLDPRIKATARQQYLFNVNLLLPFRYMELRGIQYDHEKARLRCNILKQKMFACQATLNALCGFGFTFTNLKEITERAKQVCLTVKQDRERKAYIETYARIETLLREPHPSLETVGELEDLCEVSLNAGSKSQLSEFLYGTLKLPTQWTKKRNETPRITIDYEALLNLSKYCQQENLGFQGKIILALIELRALSTRCTNLNCNFDQDTRMRFGYNIVGSNTGRTQCYISPTGRGRAGQGIPKYATNEEAPGGIKGDRDLFTADNGNFIFECDLEGADSWTVAAYCAMLGDSTMLTDLQLGIRPAKRICLKMRGVQIDYHNPQAVLEASAAVSKSSWDYFACKRVVHGGSYLEGARTIVRNILKDSEGKMFLPESEGKALKDLLLRECYPGITRYHRYIETQLSKSRTLIAASGQVRLFNGRSDEILTKAVAFEPQANTTYATNKALWRLWSDPENRQQCPYNQHLIIEPLHQVHDALLGQFSITSVVWAIEKIKSYFNNPITIAGQTITIPFEGTYGKYWGDKVGEIKP